MILTTEILDTTQKILIVAPVASVFLTKLKEHLARETDAAITVSPHPVRYYGKYDVCFFLQVSDVLLPEMKKYQSTKCAFIFFDEMDLAQTYATYCYEHHYTHIRVLNLQTTPAFYEKDIETILWFIFSRNEDIFLHIYHPQKQVAPPKKKPKQSFDLRSLRRPRTLATIIAGLVIMIHVLFIPPLLAASGLHYLAVTSLMAGNRTNSTRYLAIADTFLSATTGLYRMAQPVYHFFSASLPVDDAIQINTSTNKLMHAGFALQEDGRIFIDGLFAKNKSDEERAAMREAQKRIEAEEASLHTHLNILSHKLPDWNDDLKTAKTALASLDTAATLYETISPHLDSIFAAQTEKKYLLLFANNMELRPGGGFIGSFGILTINDYTITSLEVYDVYDADGQLTTHIDPPAPIAQFLNQPHWFLRDSAFTGDFKINYEQATAMLAQELGETDFDGGLLLTTTAVKNILTATDTLYIPDYKDTVTADNFYIKAQLYAETDFFPGSLQKKNFLASVMDQMLLGMRDVSLPALFAAFEESLDQKQLVLYTPDPALQQVFEDNYWAGRMLRPTCTGTDALHCIPDYLLQLDANLGVNKANFFIERSSKLDTLIDETGHIRHTATFHYRNNSYTGVFPGGTYKNYFQLLIPPNAFVTSITIDGVALREYDESNFEYKTVGFLMTVPPQSNQIITVRYTLPTTIVSGNGVYQLLLQKQIGAGNSDLSMKVSIPPHVTITRHNLSPLAKGSEILYNTSVSSDKIFLIEFSKK